jgi:hypothetical protein
MIACPYLVASIWTRTSLLSCICVSFGAQYIPGCLNAAQRIQVRQSLAVPDCSSVTECHLSPLSTSLFARRGPRYRESTCLLSLLRSSCNIASDSPQSPPNPSRWTVELFRSGILRCTTVALLRSPLFFGPDHQ